MGRNTADMAPIGSLCLWLLSSLALTIAMSDLDATASLAGRRGHVLQTSGSLTLTNSNRAGNDELGDEALGEAGTAVADLTEQPTQTALVDEESDCFKKCVAFFPASRSEATKRAALHGIYTGKGFWRWYWYRNSRLKKQCSIACSSHKYKLQVRQIQQLSNRYVYLTRGTVTSNVVSVNRTTGHWYGDWAFKNLCRLNGDDPNACEYSLKVRVVSMAMCGHTGDGTAPGSKPKCISDKVCMLQQACFHRTNKGTITDCYTPGSPSIARRRRNHHSRRRGVEVAGCDDRIGGRRRHGRGLGGIGGTGCDSIWSVAPRLERPSELLAMVCQAS